MSTLEAYIGDIFKVSSGGTPNRKKPEYFDGGSIPWVKTGELKGKFANKPSEFITQNALENSSAKLFPPKTVLLAMYGATIGACSILDFEAATNQACAAILPSNKCDETYLYYYLSSIKPLLVNRGVGGAQPNISAGLIKKIKIPLPPLDEQKKIAAILDAADALRQKNQQLIETYNALSQFLFLDMFGDPVTNPKGWDKVNLNTLCSFKKTTIVPQKIRQGTKYLALESIEKETGNIISYQEIDAGVLKSNKLFFDGETILYGKLRPYLNKVALPTCEGICTTEIIPLKPIENKTNKYFIVQVMRGKGFVLLANERSSGANLPRISPKEIEKYKIITPPITLQNQFAKRIQAIESQKQQAQAALQKSEDLFNSLLQRAFKGELTG